MMLVFVNGTPVTFSSKRLRHDFLPRRLLARPALFPPPVIAGCYGSDASDRAALEKRGSPKHLHPPAYRLSGVLMAALTLLDKVAKAIYESHKFVKSWDHPDTKKTWH